MPRLLLVDDNPSIHKIAESLLENSDVQLSCVESAHQALTLIERGEAFDVALVDIFMAEMDGFALVEALRKRPDTRRLPIAMMAGVLDTVDRPRFDAAQVQGLLKKPVELKDLATKIKEIMAQPVEVPSDGSAQPISPFTTTPHMRAQDFQDRLQPAQDPVPDDLLILTAEDLWAEDRPQETPFNAPPPHTQDVPPAPELELVELDLEPVPSHALEPLQDDVLDLTPLPDIQGGAAPAPQPDIIPFPEPDFIEPLPFPEVPPPMPPTPATLERFPEISSGEWGPVTDLEPSAEHIELPDLGPSEELVLDMEELESAAPQTGTLPKDWADESEDLLDAIQAALPTTSLPEPVAAEPAAPMVPEPETPPSGLELGFGAAMMAGAAAAASAESKPEPAPEPSTHTPTLLPAISTAPLPDATSIVQAILADPELMDQLAKALARHLPVSVLKEVAWEVIPDLADRIRPY